MTQRKIVFTAGCKTAMPTSWRAYDDANVANDYECVILPQSSSRRRYYEVLTYGTHFGNYERLADAKTGIEEIYGPVNWTRVRLPLVEVEHYYFGKTTEFTDPLLVYAADLPRLGATAASTTTVYRGIYLQLDEDDYANLPGSIVDRVQQGGNDYTYGHAIENLGVHWTTDKRVAHQFATPMNRYAEAPTLGSNGWEVFVPVVLTAEVSSADVVTDEEELRKALVEGVGWNGIPVPGKLPEQEVLVRPGAPIRVTDIEALSPRSWKPVIEAWENMDASRVLTMKAEWKRIGGGLQAVANLGTRLWWRVHPEHREFMPETATSLPFFPDPGERPQPGFSALDNPWHLWLYIWLMWGWDGQPDQVIGFTGQHVGEGNDGEALVMPDGGTVLRYTKREFFAELMDTPFPESPVFAPWVRGSIDGHARSWEALGKRMAWLDRGEPVEDHIARTFAPQQAVAKTAGARGDLPEGITFEVLDTPESAGIKVLAKVPGALPWNGQWAHRMAEGHTDLVGFLMAWKEGEVHVTEVSPSFRRMGIASEMFRIAKEHLLQQYGVKYLDHSESLSDDGKAWRQSLGSAWRPPRQGQQVATYGDFALHYEPGGATANLWAYHPDEDFDAGNLRWWTDEGRAYGMEPGVIEMIQVRIPFRLQGLATEMFNVAKQIEPRLHHSTNLSPAGRAWSQTVSLKAAPTIEEEWDLPNLLPRERVVTATLDGKRIGWLVWEEDTHLINMVQVLPAHRRQGLATRLLEAARALDPTIAHDTANLTDEGKAWSQAVGSKRIAASTMTWEQVKARYPVYADGIVEHAVNEYSHILDGEVVTADLVYTEEQVDLRDVRFQRYPSSDSRMGSLLEAYRRGDPVPPVLLVKRAGELLTVDGHHRLSAQEALGRTLVTAVIAHSLRAERYSGAVSPTALGYTSRTAKTAAYDGTLIARGLTVGTEGDDKVLAQKLLAGTVTTQDMIHLLERHDGRVGIWWGVMGTYGDLSDFEDHAFASEDLLLANYIEPDEDWWGGEVQVVLVAKRPTRDGQPWDPEWHNPPEAGGLMGNSYLADNEQVELVEVRYNAGLGWKSLPAQGIRVTAATTNLWWRCHPQGRPFGTEDAVSRPWGTEPGNELETQGYSCMAGPWELWGYWAAHRPEWAFDDDVIAFSGTRVGSIGFEALAVPDMATVQRMSWGEFEQMLLATPLPERVDVNVPADTWQEVAQLMLSKHPDSVVAKTLLARQATAATTQTYYHVTSYSNWPSIRDNGLRPGSGGHVWLFTEVKSAMWFKDSWHGGGWEAPPPPEQWKVPPCIVVVRTDRAVPTEAGIPGAYWVEGTVTKDEVYDVIRPEDLHHYAAREA